MVNNYGLNIEPFNSREACEIQIPVKRAFQKFQKKESIDIKKKSSKENKGDNEKNFILCRACRNEVTSIDTKISVNSSHIHTFSNPEGIVYEIGCFSLARGCINVGNPTIAFTWFPGFSWNFALCAQCLVHLGWKYQSPGEAFFGLILENIVEGGRNEV